MKQFPQHYPVSQKQLPRPAFTLVEMLVVVAIIAILLAMLLPTLSQIRVVRDRSACANNLRQLNVALNLYVDDNDGIFPPADGNTNPILSSKSASYFLDKYLSTDSKHLLIQDPVDPSYQADPMHFLKFGSVYVCPAKAREIEAKTRSGTSPAWANYSYNYVALSGTDNAADRASWNRRDVWLKKQDAVFTFFDDPAQSSKVIHPPGSKVSPNIGGQGITLSGQVVHYSEQNTGTEQDLYMYLSKVTPF